jgi:1-acyl-sn-glycerol-3-phosphate acyltransferase
LPLFSCGERVRTKLASSEAMTAIADLADGWDARPHELLVRAVRPFVRALSFLHPVTLDGANNIPRGPAVLVGNHGMLGYESPLFFERVLASSGRLPIGLADRWFFRVPGLRDLLVRLGGAYGSAANGLRALRRGEMVVCYPGGAREVFKSESEKYRCLWDRSVGFVRLAVAAKVPIVPFAAAGVDDIYRVVAHVRGSGKFLMGNAKYDLPVVWGVGPFPRPVPFWFRFGEPVLPPANVKSTDRDAILEVHEKVWSRTQSMVDELVGEWTHEQRRAA